MTFLKREVEVGKPTMADVAKEANVSRALVSIVFRGAKGASDETRQRVFAAAQQIGYRHNTNASRLASTTTKTLGVFLFDMRNDLTAELLEGVRQGLENTGFTVLVGVSDPSGLRDQQVLDDLFGARVDAIILLGAALTGSEIRALGQNIPIVSVTRRVTGLDSVISNDYAGGELIVDYLVKQGHTRISMLAPPWRPSDRVDGYTAAMHRHGLNPRIVDVQYGRNVPPQNLHRVLDENDMPTAIFAYNDIMALELLGVLRERGLRTPEDIAVVGYDNMWVSSLGAIDLTSVDQNPLELGKISAEIALARVHGLDDKPILRKIEPRLVPRTSA